MFGAAYEGMPMPGPSCWPLNRNSSRSTATLLSCDNRKVSFHSDYSCGTAAVRGSRELADGQHFWEIKMTSPDPSLEFIWTRGTARSLSSRIESVATTELHNKRFYPMACSTAAKSSMKVIRSCSTPTSLLYLCCARLRRLLPDCIDTLDVLPLPPGLRQLLHNKLGWVLSLNSGTPDGPKRPSHLPATPPAGPSFSESDSEGCVSDPEACQRKRCRWT
ncbi:hypothetical protein XENOCAPTIV_029611 [Xenoophorus captivus]|uniref:SOCS box domain-containing protein n=1 Tax=Xenoophorus captivus TaxID=1517983 RepID=A0ABV0RE70_9TELE